MTPEIKAIETVYRGYRFRSRLEARWAVVFDALGIRWQYEHEGYELPSGKRYLPDFYLPDVDMLVEVKGTVSDAQRKMVALCGSIFDLPAQMSIYGSQAAGLYGQFPGIRPGIADGVDCFLLWLDGSSIKKDPPRKTALLIGIGMHLQIVRGSGKPLYIASDAEDVADYFNLICLKAGINVETVLVAESISAAAAIAFPCGEQQRKLVEAGQALRKKALMLIGSLHEHEAELFHENGWSDVMDCWADTAYLLTQRLDSEFADRCLCAGTEARF